MFEKLQNKKILLLLHIAIWVGYSFAFFSGPFLSIGLSQEAMMMALRSLITNALLYYINIYFLLPKLLGKYKHLLYLLSVVTLLLFVSITQQYTDWKFNWGPDILKEQKDPLPNQVFEMDQGPMNPFDNENRPPDKPFDEKDGQFHFHHPSFFFGVLSALGILFLSTLLWVMGEAEKRNKREMALINENLTTEMKFLKSQINPHFLFNALNNIYSLTRIKSGKAPDMILKLSEMLRFTLYESEDKKVPIGKEIDYIRNFIEFQKIKMEGEPRISTNFENIESDLHIEPMLLIPFVENSFKHSKIEDLNNGWINIEIKTQQSTLYFNISNSLPAISMMKDKIGGIGIDNVQKRLNFLYPGKHLLILDQKDDTFICNLIIHCK